LQSRGNVGKFDAPKIENRLKPERLKMGFRRYQRGSVYRKKSGWFGMWREDILTPDGSVKRKQRRLFLGTFGELPTITAARKKVESLLRNAEMTIELSFGELYGRWVEAIRPTLKLPTARYYRHVFDKHLIPYFGNSEIRAIGKYEVQKFLVEKSAKYSTASLRGMRTALQKVFSWAIECDWEQREALEGVPGQLLSVVIRDDGADSQTTVN
jgi:hypothetical protein